MERVLYLPNAMNPNSKPVKLHISDRYFMRKFPVFEIFEVNLL